MVPLSGLFCHLLTPGVAAAARLTAQTSDGMSMPDLPALCVASILKVATRGSSWEAIQADKRPCQQPFRRETGFASHIAD